MQVKPPAPETYLLPLDMLFTEREKVEDSSLQVLFVCCCSGFFRQCHSPQFHFVRRSWWTLVSGLGLELLEVAALFPLSSICHR